MRTVQIIPIALVILISLLAGCAATRSAPADAESPAPEPPTPRTAVAASHMPPRPALINHFVVFRLHDPADVAELIADCDQYLARIPGVVSYFAGRHHDIGRGDRVYSDYDVGFFVGFNTNEAYRAYVDHPDHVMVVEKWRPRLERLRVYDVWDDGTRE